MGKKEMINAILQEVKNAAILDATRKRGPLQKPHEPPDYGDLFFTLAFRTEDELRELCQKMRISTEVAA